MVRKLAERFIGGISLLGTLAGLAQTILSFIPGHSKGFFYPILSVIVFIFFLIMSIYIIRSKNRFVGLYDICSFVSLNNKLQTLREIIFIQYRDLTKKTHQNKIRQASLHYTLKESEMDPDSYDLHYKLSFDISRARFWKNSIRNRTFRFYIITLAAAPANFMATVTDTTGRRRRIGSSGHDAEGMRAAPEFSIVECVKKDCTIRGESGSNEKEYSGLYEVIAVPPSLFSKAKRINITYEYDVFGQIKKTQNKHSFTIIPRNYGNKISSLDVHIRTEHVPISDIEFQCFKSDTDFSIPELFIPDGNPNENAAVQQGFALTAKPNMNAVYSVQFSLPNDSGGG